MGTHRIAVGQRLHWQGKTYQIYRHSPGIDVDLVDTATGDTRTASIEEITRSLFAGDLHFESQRKPGRPSASTKDGTLVFEDYPEHLQAKALARLKAIQPLLGLPNRTLADVEERASELNARSGTATISAASLYRWMRAYRMGGDDIRSLIPDTHRSGSKGQRRIQMEVDAHLEAVIDDLYFKRERVSVKDLHQEMARRLAKENRYRTDDEKLRLPHPDTITRRLKALDAERLARAKRGTSAAKRHFAQYGQTDHPRVPHARVEIDHTLLDAHVIDEADGRVLGRPTLTLCLDVATRYPLGFYLGFEPPSYLTVMECLYHSIMVKEDTRARYGTRNPWLAYGIPASLVIDNGREFIGKDLEDACRSLGITLHPTPIASPHWKGAIERFFRTIAEQFVHQLPGTTFSNTAMRGDYDSEGQACLTLADLEQGLNIYLTDIYAQDFHRGLGGIPAERWQEEVEQGFAPRLPASARDLAILLARTEERSVHHYGVDLLGIRYNHPDLGLLRDQLGGRKVKVKWHPNDLSYIFLLDTEAGGYIEVPALDQDYTANLTLWKHRAIKKMVRAGGGKVDPAALGEAKAAIRDIVAEAKKRTKGTRRRIARWEESEDPIPAAPELPTVTIYPADTPRLPLPELPALADEPAETGSPSSGWEDIDLTLDSHEGWGIESGALPRSTNDSNDSNNPN